MHYTIAHSSGMDPRELLRLLMEQRGLNPNSLSAATNKKTKQPQIHRFLTGESKEPKRSTLAPVAGVLGVPVEAFFDARVADAVAVQQGLAPMQPTAAKMQAPRGMGVSTVAHELSHFSPQHVPLVTWGDNMLNGKTPIFWTKLPDDSMAPRAPAGKLVCFDATMKPQPGDGVLVRDRAGGFYFRQYKAGPVGRWTAHAINPGYEPLDSERDGLEVVAVLKGEEGRWA